MPLEMAIPRAVAVWAPSPLHAQAMESKMGEWGKSAAAEWVTSNASILFLGKRNQAFAAPLVPSIKAFKLESCAALSDRPSLMPQLPSVLFYTSHSALAHGLSWQGGIRCTKSSARWPCYNTSVRSGPVSPPFALPPLRAGPRLFSCW